MSARHHADPTLIALVAAGGAVGSIARYGVSHALPPHDGIPVGTFVENLVGAFLLGMLLEALVRAGTEDRRRRALRLALGTGVLGGFTTYSALALEIHGLWSDGRVGAALAYGLTTVVVGTAAATGGILLGARRATAVSEPDEQGPDR